MTVTASQHCIDNCIAKQTYALHRVTKTISPSCSFIRGSSDHGVDAHVRNPSRQAIMLPL